MVKLTAEMKEDIKKVGVLPLATATKSGVPNVVPIAILEIDDSDEKDDYINIMNNFFLKTMNNIKENPLVALYFWTPETVGCNQIKGEVVEITAKGSVYEDFAARVRPEKPDLPLKEVLRVKVTEVFDCQLGKEAGKKKL
ncbi:pyridoxamine 5'-phosphate oxidase family protein [Methanimicrococcus blatticola]|uniref:Pyridoxamine 5'-phosphate oxidase N-terminal domain-containing protein n=1 Tax=Methanimicrococcus blatticola TaxID=91560 RepID=A0A484F6J7_9EURY|nr:pyridoxamine 5'-phosphate oxidase family protein [Methanimicrococcus blatticola]MBZ3935233.1 pyridoxamine 5'-phosphate oxidase family protein [Methanimicrococcus blatticola]MCC2508669.1 pyridoxamine 5'-phosphate oxidase family protein [Methanimicrococcus blatticola]TDQ71294.1 hypothetical protein C7391_0402 [Methanimicrococcus blatticola]